MVIKPEFSSAKSFVGNLVQVSVGMTDEEALLKALSGRKSEAEIEKELESHKTRYGYIDKTGKFVWNPSY